MVNAKILTWKCINFITFKNLNSEGITFQSLSGTCLKMHWWRNSFVTSTNTWAKLIMKFVSYFQIHWLLVVKLSCHFTLLLSCKIQSWRAAKNTACIFILPLQHRSHVIWQGFMLIFDRLQPPTWETIAE